MELILCVDTLSAFVKVCQQQLPMAYGSISLITMHLLSLLNLLRGTLGLLRVLFVRKETFFFKTNWIRKCIELKPFLYYFVVTKRYWTGMLIRYWQSQRVPSSRCVEWILHSIVILLDQLCTLDSWEMDSPLDVTMICGLVGAARFVVIVYFSRKLELNDW